MKKLFYLLIMNCISIQLNAQCLFNINASSIDVTCEYGNDGSITANPGGGSPPYMYSLNGGSPQSSNTFTNLNEGVYTLVVSDATPCIDSVNVSISHIQAAPVLNTISNQVVCNNSNTTVIQFISSIPGTTFNWINNNVSIGLSAMGASTLLPSFVALNPTTIPVVANINVIPIGPGPDFCEGLPQNFDITVLPDASAVLSSATGTDNQSVCIGQPIQPIVYSFVGSATNAVVSGLPAGVNAFLTGASLTIAGAPAIAGVFTYTVSTTGACASASYTGTITSTPLNDPTFSYPGSTFCQTGTNPSPIITGISGGMFSSSPPGLSLNSITGTIQLAASVAGTYNVKYVSPAPCSDSSLVSVNITLPPDASFYFPSNSYCQNEANPIPIFFPFSGAGIFSAAPAGIVINPMTGEINLASSQPGIYIITNLISSAGGCASTSYTQTIEIKAAPDPQISNITNACSCTGTCVITDLNPMGSPWLVYIFGSGAILADTIYNLCPYTHYITTVYTNGCSDTTSVTPTGLISVANFTMPTCSGGNNGDITIQSVGGIPPFIFTLDPGSVIINSTSATATFTNLSAATYTLGVTDSSGNTCITQLLLAEPTDSTVLIQTPAICGANGSISYFTIGSTTPYTYSLSPSTGFPVANGFAGLSPGLYTVVTTNALGCTRSDSITVTGSNLLVGVVVTDSVYDESCFYSGDGAIDISASPSSGLTYVWNTGQTTQDIMNINSGTYAVTVSNGVGDCLQFIDSVTYIGLNCGSISGKVFADSNHNCLWDAGDLPVKNVHLLLSNGATAMTNLSGDYFFNQVPYGNHTITQLWPYTNLINSCVQPSALLVSNSIPNLTNIDFKDSLMPDTDLSLWMYSTNYVPGGFYANIKLFAGNNSTDSVNSIISFVLNDSLLYNFATPAPNSVISTIHGDSLTWIMKLSPDYLSPYSIFNTPIIQVNVNVPTSYPMGLSIQSCGAIYPMSGIDSNLSNNFYCVEKQTNTSYDPNDKSVNPQGLGAIGGITTNDSVLDYTIRFQNTGNSPAMNIMILDTLSSLFDINSLEILASSHAYSSELISGNILKLKFNNINLPDSTNNEPLSHGFISYRLQQKNGNAIGDQIRNSASIYFDFNSPVITNTTLNTIILPTSLPPIPLPSAIVQVYPTPANDELYLQINDIEYQSIQLSLFNTTGQTIEQHVFSKNKSGLYTVPLNQIPNGFYVIKVEGLQQTHIQKIMVAH